MPARVRNSHVFINCPFDTGYLPIFHAIVFSVLDLNFVPRCALEVDDSSENRLDKIMRIIEECRYGIHDMSAVSLSTGTNLPRFNMPLELGLYLGCKRYGSRVQHKKTGLILDSEPYRYRASISDISGQDIHSHGNEPEAAIRIVRNWLAATSRQFALPGGAAVVTRYKMFRKDLPKICKVMRRETTELIYVDMAEVIGEWIRAGR